MEKPHIISATLLNNEVTVVWSTEINEIVTIVVIVENVQRNFQRTVFVERNVTRETVAVTPADSYDVTVVLYDRCGEIHKSDIFTVYPDSQTSYSNGVVPASFSNRDNSASIKPHPSLQRCMSTLLTSPISQEQCDNRGKNVKLIHS